MLSVVRCPKTTTLGDAGLKQNPYLAVNLQNSCQVSSCQDTDKLNHGDFTHASVPST